MQTLAKGITSPHFLELASKLFNVSKSIFLHQKINLKANQLDKINNENSSFQKPVNSKDKRFC